MDDHGTAGDWLPHHTLERPGQAPASTPLVGCTDVFYAEPSAGLETATVVTIDPLDPRPSGAVAVLGGGSMVYANTRNLYVATTRWVAPSVAAPGRAVTTQLHRFAIDGRGPARFVATGEVPGHLLNQFSISEHAGHLRVASTTTAPPDGGEGRRSAGPTERVGPLRTGPPPRRHAVTLPGTYSQAQLDHHAFLWRPETQQLVVPLEGSTTTDGDEAASAGAVALRWDQGGGFTDETRLQHPVSGARIHRSVAVGRTLFTVSDQGVMSSDLTTFAQLGWASFAP